MPVFMPASFPVRFCLARLVASLAFVALLVSATARAETSALHAQLVQLAERGNPAAQYHVGMMFNNGIGTGKDLKQAFAWFERGAAAGDLLASYKLGCYYAGQFRNVVPLNSAKALEHKLAAATAGYALAQVDVGLSYFQQKKIEDAVIWWSKAADQGAPLALLILSRLYAVGTDVPKDKVKSYAFFKLAKLQSGQGLDARAEAALGEMKAMMSGAELEAAELTVVNWKARPTPLTMRAASGLDEARKLSATGG